MDHSDFPETPSPQSERRFPAGTRVRMPKPGATRSDRRPPMSGRAACCGWCCTPRSGGEARSSATPIGADMSGQVIRSDSEVSCLPLSSKLSGASQASMARLIGGHLSMVMAYQAVSRLCPL